MKQLAGCQVANRWLYQLAVVTVMLYNQPLQDHSHIKQNIYLAHECADQLRQLLSMYASSFSWAACQCRREVLMAIIEAQVTSPWCICLCSLWSHHINYSFSGQANHIAKSNIRVWDILLFSEQNHVTGCRHRRHEELRPLTRPSTVGEGGFTLSA